MIDIKFSKILFYIWFILFFTRSNYTNSMSIVPYPKNVVSDSIEFVIKNGFSISADRKLKNLADLLISDVYKIYQVKGYLKSEDSQIFLTINKDIPKSEYRLNVTSEGVYVSGNSYNEVAMGVTTLLQLMKKNNDGISVNHVNITDSPSFDYRCFMLDVARQPISIETVKQCVELCRWYKIPYMQMHLSDDQLFTFPSKSYPHLASEGAAYSLDELKGLVEFAKIRGVVIIPEFDAPGHTAAIRDKMPELFGRKGLSVIDMTSEKACTAVETIMKEMMDVFYTSPYFHIGADEAWLGEFEKEEKVKEYIKLKGYDNVHDIYLEFILRMHNFVKKNGKKTIVWESFSGNGSKKVKIPTDLYVIAWETAYQRPESLLKNGYTIINASWKPAYVCPGWRWSQEYIYGWNIRRWENHWNVAPSYKSPIQLDEEVYIKGAQMCSWEMNDAYQIASLHQRIPAFSEVSWYGKSQRSYEDFKKRFSDTDDKFMQLVFPVETKRAGFNMPDDFYGLDHNEENSFRSSASVSIQTIIPNTYVTYTDDGSMPGKNSKKFSCLELNESKNIRFGVFDEDGNMLGYKNVSYILKPISVGFEGDMEPLRDRNIYSVKESFKGRIMVKLNCDEGLDMYYTIDGKKPTLESDKIKGNQILIDKSVKLNVQCYKDGILFGNPYVCEFVKLD